MPVDSPSVRNSPSKAARAKVDSIFGKETVLSFCALCLLPCRQPAHLCVVTEGHSDKLSPQTDTMLRRAALYWSSPWWPWQLHSSIFGVVFFYLTKCNFKLFDVGENIRIWAFNLWRSLILVFPKRLSFSCGELTSREKTGEASASLSFLEKTERRTGKKEERRRQSQETVSDI